MGGVVTVWKSSDKEKESMVRQARILEVSGDGEILMHRGQVSNSF